MNASAILALVAQGLALLPTLIQTGVDIVSRLKQLEELSAAGANGTATDDQIAAVRKQLDADLVEFNTDLPPAT